MMGWLSPVAVLLALAALILLLMLIMPLIRLSIQTLRAMRHRKVLMGRTEDWWPAFERELRAYAEEHAQRERSQRDRSGPA